MTKEEAWYFRHNGFHRVALTLPRRLVARLNAVTDEQIAPLAEPVVWETSTSSRTPEDVILVRGERAYTGHPHPFPSPKKGKKQ